MVNIILALALSATWDVYTDPFAVKLQGTVIVDGVAQPPVDFPTTQTKHDFVIPDTAKEVTYELKACGTVFCSDPASVTEKKPGKSTNLKIVK